MFHMIFPIVRASPTVKSCFRRAGLLACQWLNFKAGNGTRKDWQTEQVAKIATVLEHHPSADQYTHRYVIVLAPRQDEAFCFKRSTVGLAISRVPGHHYREAVGLQHLHFCAVHAVRC